MKLIVALIVALAIMLAAVADEDPGHSKHGSAFDSGMRTKPWVMNGIGNTPFPITCKNKEVQQWFNQGNALLHSFWFEEAERSFRWCLKLDPDCAMAYWGLARCGFTWFTRSPKHLDEKFTDRYRKFLNEAIRRKDKVTDRERMYIEAWEYGYAQDLDNRTVVIVDKLQAIVLKYPDDIEAKALLAFYNIGQGSAFTNQLLIDQVLAKNPMHPGAHHASIHNWDHVSSVQAIKSCEQYGKAAPAVGHARHMPGHIYSKIGMWHEAAISMDSATRTELKYMNDRLALPFETWNYAHNRNYLCYIQEQLGMAEASIKGSRDLMAAPQDPDFNPSDGYGFTQAGKFGLLRALLKFERWDDILKPGTISWRDGNEDDDYSKAYAETLANLGKGDMVQAKERYASLKTMYDKRLEKDKSAENYLGSEFHTAEGLLLAAEGNILDGQRALLDAAKMEQDERDNHNYTDDPPSEPWPIMRLVGDVYFRSGEFNLAVAAYERALKNEPNDGFSLAGLAKAYNAMGDRMNAEHYAGRLMYVWSNCDPGLKWMADVKALGLTAKPVAETPAKERVYRPADLDSIGPSNWQPYPAPKLDVLNVDGKPIRLQDYRGKNVVLIFFLGDSCVHCVEQLEAMNKRMTDFEQKNAEVLAVCSAPPSQTKPSNALKDIKITVLSDTNHENARRFASYDDFEDIELHSTILIDGEGKVRWKRTGGDPFKNVDFLLKELARINATSQSK